MTIVHDPEDLFRPPNMVGERRSGRLRIAKRLHCEFILDHNGMRCEWNPAPPMHPPARILRRYREHRHDFLSKVAEEIGGNVAVVEV